MKLISSSLVPSGRIPVLVLWLVLTFIADGFASNATPEGSQGDAPRPVLQQIPTTTPVSPANTLKEWDTIASIADKLVKILAILLGALFAYLKFFKGRIYRPRLEQSVLGTFGENNGTAYLIASIKVKNIGLSKCGIRQFGSGIRISQYQADETWGGNRVVSVLEDHQWIESGETVSDECFIPLPHQLSIAYKLELRLASAEPTWMRREAFPWLGRESIAWLTKAIVPRQDRGIPCVPPPREETPSMHSMTPTSNPIYPPIDRPPEKKDMQKRDTPKESKEWEKEKEPQDPPKR